MEARGEVSLRSGGGGGGNKKAGLLLRESAEDRAPGRGCESEAGASSGAKALPNCFLLLYVRIRRVQEKEA